MTPLEKLKKLAKKYKAGDNGKFCLTEAIQSGYDANFEVRIIDNGTGILDPLPKRFRKGEKL